MFGPLTIVAVANVLIIAASIVVGLSAFRK